MLNAKNSIVIFIHFTKNGSPKRNLNVLCAREGVAGREIACDRKTDDNEEDTNSFLPCQLYFLKLCVVYGITCICISCLFICNLIILVSLKGHSRC